MTSTIQAQWDDWSDNYYRINGSDDVVDRIDADPMWAFPAPVRQMLGKAFPDLHGIRALVPSSGDNGAVFALHLLGARVTSADISERQLANTAHIAGERGWDIRFIQSDTMGLAGLDDGAFDLVYTSNGVHIWIDDIDAMYNAVNRVLAPGGRYIMFETHPFNRPFDDSTAEVRLVRSYGDTGDCRWRVADIANAMLAHGLEITRIEEFCAEPDSHDLWWYKTLAEAEADGNKKFNPVENPWVLLPQWIGFSSMKKSK